MVESGHHPRRNFRDQNGDFNVDAGRFFDPNDVDIADTVLADGARVAVVDLVPEAVPVDGGLFNFPIPASGMLLLELLLDVATPATGAATANVGVAADAVTSDDTILDGIDVGAAAILGNIRDDAGTNGVGKPQRIAAGNFITGTASADSTGIVGKAYITFIPIKA